MPEIRIERAKSVSKSGALDGGLCGGEQKRGPGNRKNGGTRWGKKKIDPPPRPAVRCGAGIFLQGPGKFGAPHAPGCTLSRVDVSLGQIIPKVGIHYVDANVQQREEVVEVGTSKGDETED